MPGLKADRTQASTRLVTRHSPDGHPTNGQGLSRPWPSLAARRHGRGPGKARLLSGPIAVESFADKRPKPGACPIRGAPYIPPRRVTQAEDAKSVNTIEGLG